MASNIVTKYKAIFANVTFRAILTCGLCSFAAVGFGYDYVWWGSILGSQYFNEFFGELEVVDPVTGQITHMLSTHQTSSGTGIGTAGLVFGSLGASYFNERFGRRWTIVILVAFVGILGTLIQGLSAIPRSYWMCVVGKFIVNMSLGTAYAVVPLYMGECAPPEARGAFMAIYSVMQGLGTIAAGGVVYGVVFQNSLINFLLPIGLQAVMPILLIIVIPLCTPESPRWLANKGRLEEAAKVLDLLRHKTETSHDEHVLEVREMEASYYRQKEIQTQNGWVELFKGLNRKRTLTIIGAQALQQAQGASFMNSYLVVTFLSVGLTDVYLILLGVYIFGLGLAVICLFLPDYLGRRALMLGGSVLMLAGMIVTGSIGGFVEQPRGALANLMIASIFFWITGFQGGWGTTIWTVTGELPSRPLAEKSMALGAASQFTVNVIVTFVTPYLQNPGYGNLGPKVTYIFSGFCVIAFLFIFFLLPETKGKSLDEIDYMYQEGVPIRQFATYDSTALVEARRQQTDEEVEERVAMRSGLGEGKEKEEVAHLERPRENEARV